MTRPSCSWPRTAAVLVLVLAAALAPARATNVPAGTISTDTTWNLAGSPYVLLGTVTVEGTDGPDGITTLTIDPGVEVRCTVGAFALRIGVNAVGALQAGGTGSPVTFRSNGAGARGDWQGIQFQTRARASTLNNVLVQHAGRSGGPGAAVYFNSTGNVLTISGGTQVSESALAGVQVAAGTINMTGGSISSDTGVGFRVSGGTATIDGATLGSNSFDFEFSAGTATVLNTAATSVNYTTTTPAVTWTNNTFTNWGQVTSVIDPDDVGGLSNNGNSFAKVGGAVTRLLGGDVARDQSWNVTLSPYVMGGTVEVRGTDGPDGITTLTLNPGTTVRADGTFLLRVGLTTVGALQADGVTFQHNTSSAAGAWYGVHFQTASRTSSLSNCTVRHGGAGSLGGIYSQMPAGQTLTLQNVTVDTCATRALYSSASTLAVSGGAFSSNPADGINVAGGTATLTNVTATNNTSNGLVVSGGTVNVSGGTYTGNGAGDFAISAGSGTIQNTAANSVVYSATAAQFAWTGNSFTNYGQVTSVIDPDDLGSFSNSNSFTKIGGAVTRVVGGDVARDQSWNVLLSPYVLAGNIEVRGTDGPDGVTTLTLNPGTTIRADGGYIFRVGLTAVGALQADGVTFQHNTSSLAGAWYGVHFQTAARSSTLTNCTLRHGGLGSLGGIYSQMPAGQVLTLQSVTVDTCATRALYSSASTLAVTGGSYSNNSADGISIAGGSATLTNVAASANTSNGLVISGGTVNVSGGTFSGNGAGDFSISAGTGTIQNVAANSVVYTADAGQFDWSGNTFTNWGQVISAIDPDDLGTLSNSNTFSKLPGAVTRIVGGDVARDQSWNVVLSPYILNGNVEVRGTSGPDGVTTLTLTPGTAIRASAGYILRVGLSAVGALQADGVTFQHDTSTTAGAWYGIHFQTSARSSRIANSAIRHAGLGAYAGIYSLMPAGQTLTLDSVAVDTCATRALYSGASTLVLTGGSYSNNPADGVSIAGGAATLTNVTASNNGSNGLVIGGGTVNVTGGTLTGNTAGDFSISAGTGTIQNVAANSVVYTADTGQFDWNNNTFTNWGALTSSVDPDDLGTLSNNNTFAKVANAVTKIIAGDVARDQSWSNVLSPFILAGNVEIRGTSGPDAVTTLALNPGTTIRANGGYILRVGLTTVGALQADGVTFQHDTSTAAGAWYGIHFQTAARSSRIANSTVRHAGLGSYAGIYSQMPAGQTLTLDNDTIATCATRALYSSASALVVTGGSYSNNPNDGINVAGGTATLTNVTLTANGGDGLVPAGGTLTVSGCTMNSNSGYDINASGGSGTIGNSTLRTVFYGSTAPDLDWTGNTLQNWGAKTSRIDPDDLGSLTSANTFSLVTGAVTEVLAGTIAKDNNWTSRAGVLNALGTITVQGNNGPDARTQLTMGPGLTLRFPQSAQLRVGAASGLPGELIVDGTVGPDTYAPITFTTSKAAPAGGDWAGIYVLETGYGRVTSALVQWASTALRVDGVLNASKRFFVNRATTGLNLSAANGSATHEVFDFKNVDTAVQSSNSTAAFRCSNLVGRLWGVNNTTSASVIDATGNWWGDPSGPSGQGPGSGAAVSTGVTFSGFLGNPCDDGDSVPGDDGDGVYDPCTGGNTLNCDDNCPRVANSAQRDADHDGVGDACDTNPELTVSNDPADGADFAALQPAVDAAVQSGSRIRLYPGSGPYLESVVMDRYQNFAVVRFEDGTGEPAIVDGGGQPAFQLLNGAGAAPDLFDGLTLRGSAGIDSQVAVDANRVTFEFINGPALKLATGVSRMGECVVRSTATLGAEVANGAELTIDRTRMEGQTDAGVRTAGKVTLVNSLIGGGKDGVRLTAATGNVAIRYSTIASNTAIGIANQVAGTVSVDRSIVARNATDLQNVACANIQWSITQTTNCSAVNNNKVGDPLLAPDYTLQVNSPCLDHGPAPNLYTGDPGTDLDGGQRLLDFDGDGFAKNDCGAFEKLGTPPGPVDIRNLRWQDAFTLVWDADPLATQYHLYSGDVATLSYANYGVCRDDLDTNRNDTQAQPAPNPAVGKSSFYLVTGEDNAGNEGTLGLGSSAERSNYSPCP